MLTTDFAYILKTHAQQGFWADNFYPVQYLDHVHRELLGSVASSAQFLKYYVKQLFGRLSSGV